MFDTEAYFQHVYRVFQDQGNPDIAQGQMKYMRHQFEYFGLKAPHVVALAKTIHQELGFPEASELAVFARRCFADDHREMHYFALQTIEKSQKMQGAELINLLEELICTRSWWDSVDWISKLVGIHFRRFPQQIAPVTERWMDSGNMWLQRVSMIFQLSYRDKTDTDLMFRYVKRVAASKEFFLQKGAGWALRQYSRTNPAAVRAFVAETALSALTRREALRLMDKE